MADGCLRLVPVAWTNLSPPKVTELNGRPVLLALEPLSELATWVAARRENLRAGRDKLGPRDRREQNVASDGARRRGTLGTAASSGPGGTRATDKRKRRGAAAVVEQAGPSSSGGGSRKRDAQRERGTR